MIGKFKNVRISGGNVGISMPADAPVVFDGLIIDGCRHAIELRAPESLFGKLGLPPNTPPNILEEALTLLRENANKPRDVRGAILERSRLGAFLEGAANIGAIFEALLQIQERGLVGTVIEALRKLYD